LPAERPAVPSLQRVCVFCGSSSGQNEIYSRAAQQLATAMLSRGIGLVYGGGNVGLMGILADAVLAGGGHVTGVIPHALLAREVGHKGLPDLRVVATMHERKAMMADLADAFIALPGGFGTFEEFFEALTWTQLGLHRKRCGILNVHGFFDPMIEVIEHAINAGFVKASNRDLVTVATEVGTLLDHLADPLPAAEPKWIRSADV
jgi:uncharacterized protein (TIGR00730 family)